MPSPRAETCCGRWSAIGRLAASEFPFAAILLLSWPPSPRGGGSDMSELGADTIRGVPWPSNALTEVPFRVYTDPEQYRLEQERIFKGPTWSYLCLAAEIPEPGDWVTTTLGEVAVIVARGPDGAVNAFVNRCAHRGNLLCLTNKGHGKEITFSEEVEDLEAYLGPLVVGGMQRVLNRPYHVIGRSTQILPNNWKLYAENVKDTYH